MKNSYVISVDQSTSATKALLFNEEGILLHSSSVAHHQHYPREGWVEHDAEEIYANTVEAIRKVKNALNENDAEFTLALTNQRETVVVWDKRTGKPVCNAIVWQDMRGREICDRLVSEGYQSLVQERSGLMIDPYYSGSEVKWILDNVPGARADAEAGHLLLGNIDSWLIWKLTEGRVHATDYTNASRTLLFNIHTLDWDDDLLAMLTVPRSMVPKARPSDDVFGETTVEGVFETPILIAGDLGDSHGALAGQMCFGKGQCKVTYGTGSSVMVNIGESPVVAPKGMVTSVGFAALGKVFYGFEGNIHCTGATIAWLERELKLIGSVGEIESFATSVPDNGGVYLIPAFAGLGAPWWNSEVKARIVGMTLGTGKAHVCRAALESIAYQVTDLVKTMADGAGVTLRELRVDGGPTKNHFLMQFQSDLLNVPVVRSETEDASAFGAFVMNGFARGKWTSFEQAESIRVSDDPVQPSSSVAASKAYEGWRKAVTDLVSGR